jgi:hypothetical protein
MSNVHRLKFLYGILCLALLAGCSLPAPYSPTDQPFPTPNQTMTALFSTPLATAQQPTNPLPAVMTATSQAASATAVPPTATKPAPTATQVPPSATPVPPTKTPVPPTATATPNLHGLSVEAGKVTGTITLDGGWTDLPTKEYPISYIVFGAGNWKNEDDLAASFRVGWDSKYLYLGVKIHDNVYAQKAAGADLFKGDSLDVMIDTNLANDSSSHQVSSDDYQLGISPGRPDVNGTREAYLWQPSNVAGGRSQVKIAAIRDETNQLTRIEAAIPWSMLGVTPKSGLALGFTLSVSDNDDTAHNVQQTMISTSKYRQLFDPTTWGKLTLK